MKLILKTLALTILAVAGLFASNNANAQMNSDWTYCSAENQACYIRGRYDLAFGDSQSERWVYEMGATVPGRFLCRQQTFHDRDPAPGYLKECWVKPSRGRGGPGGGGGGWGVRWIGCALENQVCNVNSPTIVRYGANGSYLQMQVVGPVECSSRRFGGDPAPGIQKRCEFQSQ